MSALAFAEGGQGQQHRQLHHEPGMTHQTALHTGVRERVTGMSSTDSRNLISARTCVGEISMNNCIIKLLNGANI